jgi:hypothetical protein
LGRAGVELRPWSFFFGSTLKAICSDLGGILGGFWEPEMVPKSMFPMFFSMFFSRLISASIFSRL